MLTRMPEPTSTSLMNVYEHEVGKIGHVLGALRERQSTSMGLEDFCREAKERFSEIGIVVDVKAWYTDEQGTYAFDVELIERCEPVAFDHERQRQEILSDTLGLGAEHSDPIKGDLPPGAKKTF